ncbi:hypothetical protein ACP70R_016257 [Stipagrostis hirtigluma subsp. patula]
MGKHLVNNGFTENYIRWTYHGEADRVRDEVVRQRIKAPPPPPISPNLPHSVVSNDGPRDQDLSPSRNMFPPTQ